MSNNQRNDEPPTVQSKDSASTEANSDQPKPSPDMTSKDPKKVSAESSNEPIKKPLNDEDNNRQRAASSSSSSSASGDETSNIPYEILNNDEDDDDAPPAIPTPS